MKSLSINWEATTARNSIHTIAVGPGLLTFGPTIAVLHYGSDSDSRLQRRSILSILMLMTFAPQQNWKIYAEAIRDSQLVREQAQTTPPSMQEKLSRYAGFFDVLHQARRDLQAGSDLDWDKAQELRWREKIALRLRLIRVFRALDARDGRPTSGGIG